MAMLLLLGILDLLAGIALAVSGVVPMTASGFIMGVAIIVLLKGIYSYLAAVANDFWFDILGIIDMAVGILLVLAYFGITFGFYFWVGIALILKAFWSIAFFLIHN